MTPIARLKVSRHDWKTKAVPRATSLREATKNIRRLSGDNWKLRSQNRQANGELKQLRARIAELEAERATAQWPVLLSEPLQQSLLPADVIDPRMHAPIRALCVTLVISAVISFRSVPRVLSVLQDSGRIACFAPPHFTSIIHWAVRAGISILHNVGPLNEPWLALMDCSIDIGTRKALLVLRVRLSALGKRGSAITYADCECIGIRVSNTWNGALVDEALTEIFGQAGQPMAIIKDQGTDLSKGVRLYRSEQQVKRIGVVDDVGHAVANALKAKYSKRTAFRDFLRCVRNGAARIRQTHLASHLPPKVRTKGRFQGISKVVNWADKMLGQIGGQGRAVNGSDQARLRAAFRGLAPLRPFLEEFKQDIQVSDSFLELMKQEGLNRETYLKAKTLLAALPEDSMIRTRIMEWLDKHLRLCCRMSIGQQPMLVSTDIIESVFGAFKTIVQRNPRAELNRLVYLFTLLCGEHDESKIAQAIATTSHQAMLDEISESLPPTMRQKRRKSLNTLRKSVPETGKNPPLHDG